MIYRNYLEKSDIKFYILGNIQFSIIFLPLLEMYACLSLNKIDVFNNSLNCI